MLPSPRVMAIDDELTHLAGLTKGLNQYGTACLPVHFDGQSAGVPQCPQVRVIFIDLHLTPTPPGDYTQDFSIIGGLLEEKIKPTGPYLIVLWTQYPEQADKLLKHLEDRLEGVTKPFAVRPLDKNDHLDLAGVKNPGSVRNIEKLVEAVRRIVAGQPQVGALLDWEERVLGAAADSVSSIMELTESAPGGVSRSQEISRLLASLAVAAVGEEHVEEDRFRAVNEALLPILADRIASMRSAKNNKELWEAAFETGTREKLSSSEAAKLNRLLHIATRTNSSLWFERGSVIPLPDRFSGSKFQKTFGLKQEEAAEKQFGCKGFSEKCDRFRWVLVQSQAACDYAQMRKGPFPFHLGLCLPVSTALKRGLPAALWPSPCFEFNDETFLHVNASFQIALSPTTRLKEKPLFRLREQLLNDMIYRLHSHGARPGIISLRA